LLLNSSAKWCNGVFWLPCLLMCMFLIGPQWKYDARSSPGCLPSSCGRFLSNLCSSVLQYHLLAAFEFFLNRNQYTMTTRGSKPAKNIYWIVCDRNAKVDDRRQCLRCWDWWAIF
jgi:hypothetical protein